jgi:DNA polymerase III epsilon subunit-like protein
MEGYFWHLWKNTITPAMVRKGRSMLSWSAKWLFDDRLMGEVVTADEAHNRKDGSIMSGIWNLLDEADIAIAHNGNSFDIKIVNTRFAVNELPPPSPYRSIDTLRAAKRVFNMPSFTLDEMNKEFGLELKMDHEGMDLWKKCVYHDEQALKTMLKYNKRDVVILEELYMKLRPWIKGHPNLALYIDTEETLCTNCGSSDLNWLGYYYTPAGKYRSFRCNNCQAIGRSRTSDLGTEEKKRLLLSIAQ